MSVPPMTPSEARIRARAQTNEHERWLVGRTTVAALVALNREGSETIQRETMLRCVAGFGACGVRRADLVTRSVR